MRRTASLCAVLVTLTLVPAEALAQLPPGAFGALGMYPKRLSCSDLPVFVRAAAGHRIPAAHEGDAKLRRAFAAPDTVLIPGGTRSASSPASSFSSAGCSTASTGRSRRSSNPAVVHTAGWITVTAVGRLLGHRPIDYACDGFIKGDYLEAFTPAPMPRHGGRATASPSSPTWAT